MRGIKHRNITFSTSNLREKDFSNLLHVCGHVFVHRLSRSYIAGVGVGLSYRPVQDSESAGLTRPEGLAQKKTHPTPHPPSPMLLGVFAFHVITALARLRVRLISIELS